jgi:hypothetical protein
MNSSVWRRCGRPLLAGVLACLSAPLHAADDPGLRPGDRVRYSTRPGRDQAKEGTLVELTGTTLTVDRPEGPEKLSIAALTRLEVARGYQRRTAEGIVLGIGAGFLLGTAVWDSHAEMSLAPLASVICGFLAGALIGTALKVDRWKEVPKHQIHVTAGPVRGGFGGQVSIRF